TGRGAWGSGGGADEPSGPPGQGQDDPAVAPARSGPGRRQQGSRTQPSYVGQPAYRLTVHKRPSTGPANLWLLRFPHAVQIEDPPGERSERPVAGRVAE